MSDFLQVITTTNSEETASKIAQQLVEDRLAACVQVQGPLTSTYWWQGTIEKSQEWSCVIKTNSKRYLEVEAKIRALHPYEEPEILAFPVVQGSGSYLRWLSSIVDPASDGT